MLSNEFDSFMAECDLIKSEMVLNLEAELIRRTPVDTSTLKGAWTLEEHSQGWTLLNNMEYADFIFNGRRQIGNKTVGSLQLPDGVAPILQEFNNELQDRLRGVRR